MSYVDSIVKSAVPRRAVSFVIFSLLSGALVKAPAQRSEDCGCNVALVKDLRSVIYTDVQQWDFLSILSDKEFDSLKHDASATAGLPIISDIIKASANYEDLQQKLKEHYQKIQSSGFRDQRYKELQLVASPIAYRYWSECMRDCAKSRTGIFAWKDRDDKDRVVIIVRYNAQPNPGAATPAAVLSSQLLGGQAQDAPKGRLFPANSRIATGEEKPVIVQRQGKKGITATISAGGFTARPSIYSKWEDLTESHPPTILPGTLNPNAYITLDTDRGKGAFKDQQVQEFDLSSPIPLRGPNMPHPPLGTAALAQYQASFTATPPNNDNANATMLMTARVGGTCGKDDNGGAGGVSPVWTTHLELPGSGVSQAWNVLASTDLRHVTSPAGSCSLTLNSDTRTIPTVGTWSHNFDLPVGSYLLTFSCGGPNPYNGCSGHAVVNGRPVDDHYEDEKYQVNVSATRTAKRLTRVTPKQR